MMAIDEEKTINTKKKLLVIEDSSADRALLLGFLQNDYKVYEATNATQGLALINSQYQSLSAIILDLMMPGIDGFQVLTQIKANPLWAHIPVIITTEKSEEEALTKALNLGAVAYITKPYNQNILLKVLSNIINLCELSVIASESFTDPLTGLYSKDAFLSEATKLIKKEKPGYYVLSYLNIDHFKVINDQYGQKIGDKILLHIGKCLRELDDNFYSIASRFTADKFVMLFPAKYCETPGLLALHDKVTSIDFLNQPLTVRVGRYLVEDLSLSVSAMYDRAILAETSIQDKYNLYIAKYDESMRQNLIHEQKIVSTMEKALKENQFEPWYQAQYNHASKTLIGAEALVRWRDPKDNHIIPPCDFIPVFEKTGFIYELDKYIWEKVCIQIRKWIDNDIEPLPISVNI